MLGYFISFIKSLIFGKVRYYNQGFKRYIRQCYKLSEKEYTDISQMQNVDYDVLIVGSDQVWNPEITDGLDKVFLLEFGHPIKKLSIASSMGSKKLAQAEKNQLVKALVSFDAVSVREEFAKQYLSDSLDKEIKVLADPTFLLTQNQWIENIAKKSSYYGLNDKFILTYFVSNDKKKKSNIEIVKSYSALLGLPVWAIKFSTYFSKGVDKKILGASIFDFLALLSKAQLIITDSFHGAALSINFNKDFISIINTENPVRTEDLLSKLGLTDRINMLASHYREIDYEPVNKMVSEIREDSQAWIKGILKEYTIQIKTDA